MKVEKLNFSHDLAIASNVNYYTPPPNVQIMERDLEALADYLPKVELSYNPMAPVWGWDKPFVNLLRKKGYNHLPSDEQLDVLRELSSRKTAVEVLADILEKGNDLPLVGRSEFVTTAARLDEAVSEVPLIMKEPLSGSGRGLRFVYTSPTEAQMNWARRCIRQQGGVVLEPLYDKIADFALEFLATENDVEYTGLSVFETDKNNVYSGNVITHQDALWQRLNNYFEYSVFQDLLEIVRQSLTHVFLGKYLGPLGVDMMIVRAGENVFIHPCVEINVRRTMGEFSLHLQPLVSPGVEAFFCLVFKKTPMELKMYVNELPEPEYDEQNRLVKGTRILTPILEDTHYVALLKSKR